MSTSEILTLSVALVSLVVSGLAAYKAYYLSGFQVRVANRLEYQKFLFEIDKLLIAHPRLWAVFDQFKHLAVGAGDDGVEKAQREAFLQLHTDLLEIVHVFFAEAHYLKREDPTVVQAWENWARYLVHNSSEFREFIGRPEFHAFWNKRFVEFVRRLLDEYNNKPPR